MLQESFTVKLWKTVFRLLKEYHPLTLLFRCISRVCKVDKKSEREYAITDLWIHLNLVAVLFIWVFHSKWESTFWLLTMIIILGALRISFILIYNANVVLFDPFIDGLQNYRVRSIRRLLIHLFINYIEVLLWFAVFYRFYQDSFNRSEVCLNNPIGSLYFSIVTMATLGYGDIRPIDYLGACLSGLQTLTGIFLIVVMVARFIAVLPHIETHDPAERIIATNKRESDLST